MSMKEEVKYGPSSVEYHLEGPQQWVDQRIADLMVQFDPWGYGTRVSSNSEKDGVKRAVVWRANSCD